MYFVLLIFVNMGLWSKGINRSKTGEDRLGEKVFSDRMTLILDKIEDFIRTIQRNNSVEGDAKYITSGKKLIWTISGHEISVRVGDPESLYNIYFCIQNELSHYTDKFPLNVIEMIMQRNLFRHDNAFFKNYEMFFDPRCEKVTSR